MNSELFNLCKGNEKIHLNYSSMWASSSLNFVNGQVILTSLFLLFVAFLQLCDGSIVAFTVLHNVNCNHGLIYVTSQV